jgi:hypothetical protein
MKEKRGDVMLRSSKHEVLEAWARGLVRQALADYPPPHVLRQAQNDNSSTGSE